MWTSGFNHTSYYDRPTHRSTHTRSTYGSTHRSTHGSNHSNRSNRSRPRVSECDMDFKQRVLQWDLRTLKDPTPLINLPAKHSLSSYSSYSSYYESFIPHILEESRCIIRQGLDNSNKCPTSILTLSCDVSAPRVEGNPWILSFTGRIDVQEDHSPYMNVLLLTPIGKNTPKRYLLAIANEGDNNIKARARVFHSFYYEHKRCFKANQHWRATFLGCLVTQERMFDACKNGVNDIGMTNWNNLPISKIAHGEIGYTPSTRTMPSAILSNLNQGQSRAFTEFKRLPEGGTLLLQGPPGTGKTTTLVTLLEHLTGQRNLVCAASNKAIQVLAERFYDKNPDSAMILVGVEGKIPDKLRPISLNHWLKSITDEIDRRVTLKQHLLKRVLDKSRTWFELLKAKFEDWMEKNSRFQILIDCIDKRKPSDLFSNDFNVKLEVGYSLRELLEKRRSDELIEDRDNFIASFRTELLKYHFKGERDHLQRLETQFRRFGIPIETANLKSLTSNIKYELETNNPNKWIKLLTTQCESLEELSNALKRNQTIEMSLLNGAHWIFSTLSIMGRTKLTGCDAQDLLPIRQVDNLVVDEAAQSVEAETLIAFQYQPKRVLLVGDTKQLPATVISEHAKTHHYDWSMMWRLQEECSVDTLMLSEQYRMHPEICEFPSRYWYEGKLKTAASLEFDAVDGNSLFRPYTFYNMGDGGNFMKKKGTSSYNPKEAKYVAKVVESCQRQLPCKEIGIITFYTAQVEEIQNALKKAKCGELNKIRVSSVDSFQGGEADIIILSFVRAPDSKKKKGRVGFVNDFRRLNVALTRAKSTLIMLGHAKTLDQEEGSALKELIHDARVRGHFYEESKLRERLIPPMTYADLTTEMSSLSIDNKKLDRQETSTASSAREKSAPSTHGKKSAN